MLGPEPAELSAIARNSIRPLETPETEGTAAGVASISDASSFSRISSGTIASNQRNKSSSLLDRLLEAMKMQMIHEVQQRSFDKEDLKENEKQRIGRGRNGRTRRPRIKFIVEKMFLIAICGGINMIKSGKHKERHNTKDSGGENKK